MTTASKTDNASLRLDRVEELMLVPTGVGLRDLESAMNRLMSRQLDYADLYCQLTRYEGWTVEGEAFGAEYLVPFAETKQRMFEVRIVCGKTVVPSDSPDQRQLGVMIFRIGLES